MKSQQNIIELVSRPDGHHQQGSSANAASIRMGSMTPNRFTAAEMLRAKRAAAAAAGQAGLQGHGGLLPGETDSHGDAEGGGGHEFRRSASARLHRNKRNNPEMFQQDAASSGPQDEHKRKEQVLNDTSFTDVLQNNGYFANPVEMGYSFRFSSFLPSFFSSKNA